MADVIAGIVVGLSDLLVKGLHRDSETFPP